MLDQIGTISNLDISCHKVILIHFDLSVCHVLLVREKNINICP